MSTKPELIDQAKAKNIALTGDETKAELEAKLAGSSDDAGRHATGGESLPEDQKHPSQNGEMTTASGSNQRNDTTEEAAFQKTAGVAKARLAAEPKTGVYIPLEHGEPKGTQLPVEINGAHYSVPKGVPNVQVPVSIAEIVWRHLGVYEEASAALRSANNPDRPLRLDLQNESDRSRLDA